MKVRFPKFLTVLTKLFILILLILFFTYWILFPLLEDINRLKREKKDLELKISDLKQMSNRFYPQDKKEEVLFKNEDDAMKRSLVSIDRTQDIKVLADRFRNYVQKLARLQGLPDENYILVAEDKIPEIKSIPEKSPELRNRAASLFKEIFERKRGKTKENVLFSPPGLHFRRFVLFWTADMAISLKFLNRLTWGNEYVSLDEVAVYPEEGAPLFMAGLRLYFFDENRQPSPATGTVDIDYNSPMLLERVYWHLPEKFSKKKLNQIGNLQLFKKREQ